jgi:hypothetical protein
MFAMLLLLLVAVMQLGSSSKGLPKDFHCWVIGKPVAVPKCGLLGCVHATSLPGLGWSEYPLTAEHLGRSVPYMGDTQRLHEILRAAASKHAVLNIVVLGGSVPSGHHCTLLDGRTEKDCAWPARLNDWLKKRFPKADIQLENAARGECLHVQLPAVIRSITISYDNTYTLAMA